MPSHTISVLVENEFGVLARVAGLFSGRGFNIQSLTVNEDPLDPTVSRIVLVSSGDDTILEQINKQLNRLISVIKVTDLQGVDIGRNAVTVELTGDEEKIKAFIALVRPLGIKEIVRSGKIAMARAVQPSDNHNRRPAQKAGEP